MMKKYLFYMMAAVIASGLTACSSNDDLDLESSAEQTFTSPYATIRASFGEEDATTRVAMDGLSLSWSEGDAIGVVYSDDANNYKIIKYNYNGDGEFVVDEDAELEKDLTPVGCAFYPYSEYTTFSADNGLATTSGLSFYQASRDGEIEKIRLPLISSNYDETNGLYTFRAACSIFAVKVKNLAKDMGYETASLYDNKGFYVGCSYGYWTDRKWVDWQRGYKYIFDLTDITYDEDGTVDQTFYFPLPTGTYSGLTFKMTAGQKQVGFTLNGDLQVETANVKYAKVIELNDDGTRKDDAITLAKCELEVSNTVSVDFTNAASEETFYIPESVKGGTSVDITMSNVQWGNAVYLKQEENVETAKDVNLYHIDSFNSSLTINLPNSNIYIDSDESNTYKAFYGALVVEKAKSFTWGKNDIVFMCGSSCFKEVSEVTVDCETYATTVEGSAAGEEPRTMTLTINNTFRDNTITGNITLTVVNNTSNDVIFNSKAITAPANATTVLHVVDGKLVED
jgi:hypothetical protein